MRPFYKLFNTDSVGHPFRGNQYTSGGLSFVPDGSRGMIPVMADVSKVEPAWSKNEMYVGPGGAGQIHGRYEGFKAWLAGAKDPVEMPRAGIGIVDPSR